MSSDGKFAAGALGAFAVLVLIVVGFVYGAATLKSRQAPKPGYIGVCQTGGPIEGSNDTCGIAQPGSGKKTWGAFNDLRLFPSTQRNFTLANVPGSEGGPVTLTTKDGVNVSVSVRYLFTLDRDKIVDFYKAYGQREYQGKHVYDYDGGGWDNYLRSEFTPIATQSLRKQILNNNCADLNPQCAVLGKKASNVGGSTEVNLNSIQSEAGTDFNDGLVDTLGGSYFSSVRVASLRVDLPSDMQKQVNAANAAKAQQTQAEADGEARKARADADATVQVTKAKADRDTAILSAQGLKAKAQAYAKSPAKAQVDAIANLPRTITTLVIGGGKNGQIIQVGK